MRPGGGWEGVLIGLTLQSITTDVEWVEKLEERKEAKGIVEAIKEANKLAKAQKKVSKGIGGVKKPKRGKKKASMWA